MLDTSASSNDYPRGYGYKSQLTALISQQLRLVSHQHLVLQPLIFQTEMQVLFALYKPVLTTDFGGQLMK